MIRRRLLISAVSLAIAAGGAGSVVTSAASAAVHANVTFAPPTVKPGHKCAKGVAGCTNGKFTGNFFGD